MTPGTLALLGKPCAHVVEVRAMARRHVSLHLQVWLDAFAPHAALAASGCGSSLLPLDSAPGDTTTRRGQQSLMNPQAQVAEL